MVGIHEDIFATTSAFCDEDSGVVFRANAHRKQGVLILRELDYDGDPDLHELVGAVGPDEGTDEPQPKTVLGLWIDFPDEEGTLMFVLTPKQREAFKMSDHVYQELNVGLRLDYDKRQKERLR